MGCTIVVFNVCKVHGMHLEWNFVHGMHYSSRLIVYGIHWGR